VPGSKPLAPLELRVAYRENHRFREPVAESYPALREAGRRLVERGVAFHDLTRVFENERRPVYNDDCCHLNRLGNELVAQEIVAAIVAESAAEGEAAGDGAAGDAAGR
jgi:hypothetical protein